MSIPAFPPFRSISSPASVANGWDEETTPFVPYTTDRRLGNCWKISLGSSTLDQSILTVEDVAMIYTEGHLLRLTTII